MKSKTSAGLLAIFLGGLGIHKFYLGQHVQGILYVLFCWTYIPSLIGLIEGIYYFVMDENQFNIKYNSMILHDVRAITPPNNQFLSPPPISNHITFNVPNSHNIPPSINNNTNQHNIQINTSEEVRKIYDLYVAGILTEEEFNFQKKKILGM